MDCQFCAEFAGASERIILDVDGWVLLPTVGCFTPGYCLFMPLRHIDAAAELSPARLMALQPLLERMRGLIERRFGPTIIAEHGSRNCELGAGCCTHCHLHLIPVPDVDAITVAYEMTGGAGRVLAGLADLAEATLGPYLYLSPRPGRHLLWDADGRFARQYVRRVCAESHAVGGRFDWRDHPFTEHQQTTFAALRTVPALALPAAGSW